MQAQCYPLVRVIHHGVKQVIPLRVMDSVVPYVHTPCIHDGRVYIRIQGSEVRRSAVSF